MQRANKNNEPLKLQSYKLDSEVLASKINELNELKSELESSLTYQKMKEENVVSELESLKVENQKLRASLSNSQFTKKTQMHLIQQLQDKLQNAEKRIADCLKKMEVVETEKKQLTEKYAAQQQALRQSRAKYLACEQKLIQMSQVVQCVTPRSLEKLMKMQGSLSSIEQKPVNSGKKIKKLKKPSIQMESGRASIQLSQKYLSGNVIVQRQEDSQLSGQDVYLEMIRQLFRQLNKIDIAPRELFKIPQIEAFARLRNPTNNDLIKLLTVYPFNLKEAEKVELIYQFMEDEAVRKGKTLGGRMIIEQIIGQIEQVQGLRAARSFCETSSLHSESINQYIGSTRAKTQPIRSRQQMPSATIDSNIELQSDNSSYF